MSNDIELKDVDRDDEQLTKPISPTESKIGKVFAFVVFSTGVDCRVFFGSLQN
jgi:hypothetical protein